jgi:flagellar hook-length control protein FliK
MKVQTVLSNLVLDVAATTRSNAGVDGAGVKSSRRSKTIEPERGTDASRDPRGRTKQPAPGDEEPDGFSASLKRSRERETQIDNEAAERLPANRAEEQPREASDTRPASPDRTESAAPKEPRAKADTPRAPVDARADTIADGDAGGSPGAGAKSANEQISQSEPVSTSVETALPADDGAEVAGQVPSGEEPPSESRRAGDDNAAVISTLVEGEDRPAIAQRDDAAARVGPGADASVGKEFASAERVVYERPLTIAALNELLARLDPTLARAGITPAGTPGVPTNARPNAASVASIRDARPGSAGAGAGADLFTSTSPGSLAGGAPSASFGAVVATDAPTPRSAGVVDAGGLPRPGTTDGDRPATRSTDRTPASGSARDAAQAPAMQTVSPAPAAAAAQVPTSGSGGERSDSTSRMIPGLGQTGPRPGGARSAGTPGANASANAALPASLEAQVTRGVSALLAQGPGSITLRMVPEDLGQLRVHMSMKDGSLSLRFETGNGAARELLDSAVADLRSTLEARGLSVERLSVTIDPSLAEPANARTHTGTDRTHDTDAREGLNSQDAGGQNLAGDGAGGGASGRDAREFAGAFRGGSEARNDATGTDARSGSTSARSADVGQVTIEFEPGGTGGLGRARINGVL